MRNKSDELPTRGLSFSCVAIKLATFLLLYLWKFEGIPAAGYIFQGYIWWLLLLWAILLFATDITDQAPYRTRTLEVFHGSCSIALVCMLIWLGHPLTAAAYLGGRLARSAVSARSISQYALQQ